MKKIFFMYVAALSMVSCGSENVVADATVIHSDATEKIGKASSIYELNYIEMEMMIDLYELYKANKEDCDLIAENLRRNLNDKDFGLMDGVELNKFCSVYKDYKKERDELFEDLSDDKNQKDYKEFNEYLRKLDRGNWDTYNEYYDDEYYGM